MMSDVGGVHGRGRSFPVAIAGLIAAATALGLHLQLVSNYFFLYDDYALIGQTADLNWLQIVDRSLFGFWRPLSFLLQSQLELLLGWAHPWGYAAGSMALHAVTCVLVGRLASQLGASFQAALGAALIAWISPYATEAMYWLSAQFDLWSTCGMLISLCAGLQFVQTTERRMSLLAVMLFGSVIAMAGKENGIVLPAYFLALAAVLPIARQPTRMRRIAWVAGMQVAVGGFYLWWRTRLLGFGGGAYGSFWDLVANANLTQNLASYVVALLLPPLPEGESLPGLAAIAFVRIPFLLVCLPGLVVALFRTHATIPCVGVIACLLTSILPVVWFGVSPDDGSRFVYLPGIFFGVFMALAWDAAWTRAGDSRRVAAVAALAIVVLGGMTWSRLYQQQRWMIAFKLSREALTRMTSGLEEADRLGTRELFLRYVPDRLVHGPPVMKGYALQYVHNVPDDRIAGTSSTALVSDGSCVEATAIVSQIGAEQNAMVIDVGPSPGERICF
ncbi:MAG: hypothetical protein AB7I50_05225 [Vicinamibacterales bacterium]